MNDMILHDDITWWILHCTAKMREVFWAKIMEWYQQKKIKNLVKKLKQIPKWLELSKRTFHQYSGANTSEINKKRQMF